MLPEFVLAWITSSSENNPSLTNGGHVVFLKHPTRGWEIPGGHLEPGESPEQALIREVLEETGWGIRVIKKEGVFQRFTYMPEYNIWAHKVCHIYTCVATMQKTKQLEKNHRFIIMNKKKALETFVDKGFKYFTANV